MEKLIAALFLFGVTELVAISALLNKAATLRAILHWLLGFVALVVVVLFAQMVVFEWLKWNGTSKNDWFFYAVVDSRAALVRGRWLENHSRGQSR
jgi:zinc transporter ZupT